MGTRSAPPARRFDPDPRVVGMVERHGAARVGRLFALDGDALRRYAAGVSQRTTQWWIELNAETVERELAEGRRPAPLKEGA